MKYLIALDAGTTSVRAYLYDPLTGRLVRGAQQEVGQSFPRPGWVEQDANEIFYKCAYVLNDCVQAAGAENVAGVGLTNQRETVVFWDRKTGEPVCPAIVWQCRRTSGECAKIPADVREKIVSRTGLLPDAYFSASKIRWNLDHIPEARRLLKEGRLCAGTVDSYLIFKLTGNFYTDYTNASRTMLFNLHTLSWDGELCDWFGIQKDVLPTPVPCDFRMGETSLGGRKVPVCGVLGDQQAALFGQSCLGVGDAKITYGTGLFMLLNTGNEPAAAREGLLSTVGYSAGGKTVYALEGSAFNAGSGVQWLRDGLGILTSSAESEQVALSVPDTGGAFFVPAFTGLGAPRWDGEARALLCGVTRGTTRAHVVRAVLESIAYEARDLADCMARVSGVDLREIRCDGGASANNFLMQFQSDVLGIPVNRPCERESTALGAARMAAGSLGMADAGGRAADRIFLPSPDREKFDGLYRQYCLAVDRAVLK